MKQLLTYEEAHRLFRYDLETGKLFWRVSVGRRAKAGAEAGNVVRCSHIQYRKVKVKGKKYFVHRVIYLMLYGQWPENDIDHADGDGMNNRPSNLRDVPRTTNTRNARMRRDNASGVNGVTWHKAAKKWSAQSYDESGKRKHLGLFTDLKDAERAVREFQSKLGFTERHGLAC